MKATEAKLLEFLKKAAQFVIPIYQRTYSWGEKECQQLWDDIIRAGKNEKVPAHFVGSIVYVEKGLYQVSSQSPLLVIDGQQRLTTVTLLIEALARKLAATEPLEGFSAKKLRNYYLLNDLEEGEKRFKLILSQTDKESLMAILGQQPKPQGHSLRVNDNFDFFEQQLTTRPEDVESLCKGLAKLIVVDISLNRDQDNPQLIFESLNSTGLELSQADLIRNFILMGLETQLQTSLYEQYWRPMEVNFGQEAYASQFDSFMRHYLTVKSGEIPTVRAVYEAFKQYSRSAQVKSTEDLVADIRTFAGYYCAMALGNEPDPDLKTAFHDIAAVPKWDKAAILDRAEKLASMASAVWIAPKLMPEVLDTYRTKPSPTSTFYTIKDHPHLESGQMRSLFDEFRKQVLALDPCVTEEFLKLYVAYKAETNFVDVVPQAKRLRLT